MVINQFIASITLKTLVGTVLAAAMIISFLYLSQDLHIYLGKFEDGDLLQLGAFGFLLAAACAGLYFLFRNKKSKTALLEAEISISTLLSFDYTVLVIKFLEGFIISLTKETNKEK